MINELNAILLNGLKISNFKSANELSEYMNQQRLILIYKKINFYENKLKKIERKLMWIN